jgi:hypothetical protein
MMTRFVDPATFRKARASKDGRLSFRWESFHKLSPELAPLFKRHWREIALDQKSIPLDPDWDCYFALDMRGILHVLTARSGKTLVGYIFNLVGPHNHYASTRFAHTEMFWLAPEHRKGWQPVRMFLENLAGLKAREVQVATINFKLHFQDARVGKLLARLGYAPTDIVMRKML